MFAIKKETVELKKALMERQQGDELTPKQMQDIIGCDCNGSASPGYRVFYRVVKRVENETDGEKCWRWDGDRRLYRCLTNAEMPHDVGTRTDQIRRKGRRNVKIANAIDQRELSPEMQKQVQVLSVINSLVSQITSRSAIKKAYLDAPVVVAPSAESLLKSLAKRETA